MWVLSIKLGTYFLYNIGMKTIRIINDENEQIINLPEEYRFDGEEVCIEKLGDVVIIRPKANE